MIMSAIRRMFGGGDSEGVTCMEALERIYEFLDGELDASQAAEIEEHFEKCTLCYPHLKMEERFRARLCTAISKSDVPPGLRERVLEILDGADSDDGGEPAH